MSEKYNIKYNNIKHLIIKETIEGLRQAQHDVLLRMQETSKPADEQ